MEKKNIKKVAVVTGASSGIGLATCNLLSKCGYTVYGIARRQAEFNNFNYISCDVTDYNKFAEVIKTVYQKEGKIDLLINDAGFGISGAVEFTENESTKKLFDINVLAVVNACKEVIPYFKNQGYGKIINVSSLAAVFPIPFQTAYSMSKAAINSFTMCLKQELKPFNIKVSAVMPGDTKTGFTSARLKEEKAEGYGKRIDKSVSKMEKDEQKGVPATVVAKKIYKLAKSKNPPVLSSVGLSAKLINFLRKIVPTKFMLYIVGKLYG